MGSNGSRMGSRMGSRTMGRKGSRTMGRKGGRKMGSYTLPFVLLPFHLLLLLQPAGLYTQEGATSPQQAR